jgi:glycosyltransferase involved in cell wall biosynthesis
MNGTGANGSGALNGGSNGNGAAHSNGNGGANGNGGNGAVSVDGGAAKGAARMADGVTVSVVVPTLNEVRNLPFVLPRIPAWVDQVVLVDGGSEDGTVEVARALIPDVDVVREYRPGKGAALQAGFRAAWGDIIVTLDADGSADPAEIPAFVGCLLAGADYAKGSRFTQGGGTRDMELLRRAGNWGLRLLVRIAFGGRYSDLCYGYNAFWRHVLPVIDGDADGFEIETLMNVRVLAARLRVAEVASHEEARIHGESHLNTFRDGFRVLRLIVRERRHAIGSRPPTPAPPSPPELPSQLPEQVRALTANGRDDRATVDVAR